MPRLEEGKLLVWDAQSGERLHAWSEPSAIVYTLAWSPTGALPVSGGSDGMLRWWDIQRGECLVAYFQHIFKVGSYCWGSTGGQGVAKSGSGSLSNSAFGPKRL